MWDSDDEEDLPVVARRFGNKNGEGGGIIKDDDEGDKDHQNQVETNGGANGGGGDLVDSSDDDNDSVASTHSFQIIDQVEWGPRKDEEGYDTDQELVPRPIKKSAKKRRDLLCGATASGEACMCLPQEGACSDHSCMLFACNEECQRNSCPAGQFCRNQRIQNKEFKKLQVFDAGIKGKGLKCLEDVKAGDLLCEYYGRAVKESKLKSLFRRYEFDRRLYIMGLGHGVYLDARHKGGVARFINHSCQPNCRVDRWSVKGILRAVVVALVDIAQGTELTFDYQWERKRGRAPTKCHCMSANCRGTLEVKKSLEESNLEEQLQGHWECFQQEQLTSMLDHTIVNRTIRVKDQATDEYFLGEITGYNSQTGLHSVLYRHDMSEAWEDLSKEDWMILNAKMDENYMISKKQRRKAPASEKDDTKRLLGIVHQEQQQNGGMMVGGVPVKHYLYVQTPIKNALYFRHLIELCQRNYSVQISSQQFARPPLPCGDDPEDIEKYAALDASQDGTVWKLSLTGVDLASAYAFLEQQSAMIEQKLDMKAQSAFRQASVLANADGGGGGATAGGVGAGTAALAAGGESSSASVSEVVYPRVIADAVKRRLQSLRERCKGVTIVVAPSYSKSKQFARLVLEGDETNLSSAQEVVWNALVALCNEENVPFLHKVPINLGFLGGVLTANQFRLMLGSGSRWGDISSAAATVAASALATVSSTARPLSTDAGEDLRLMSSFFSSFENTQRCTVWVQSDDDKGRINGENQIVQEESVKGPRKVYLGCEPKDVSRLWGYIQTRAAELERGVRFLHLGLDRVYQVLLLKSQIFEFVLQVTGATVKVDPITGDHLCMDGRTGREGSNVDLTLSEEERASLAEELIRLQIEIYRDHCVREQSWMFGRDWTLVASTVSPSSISSASAASGGSSSPTAAAALAASTGKSLSSFGQLDCKSAAQGAFEIAEVVANLGLRGNVGGHAAIILYRFVSVKKSVDIKVREALLACVFLANKCQKESKWRRLEVVLEAGYETFYPGTKFDRTSEEVLVLEDRVLAAEKDILQTLNYDIFWRDVEWMTSAATGEGRMTDAIVQNTFDFVFSGPVLGTGPELWLKYGVDCIFAAGAALLDSNIEALVPALGLMSLKVSQAVELLVENAKLGRPTGKKLKCPALLAKESGRGELEKRVPRIKETCNAIMMKMAAVGTIGSLFAASAVDQRYKIISDRSRRRFVIRGIPALFMRDHILPILDKVAAASSCSVFIRTNPALSAEDLMLDGSWRAIAVAENLIQRSLPPDTQLPPMVDATAELSSHSSIQAKVEPGRVRATDIQTSAGWDGTIQSMISNESFKGRRIGGKSCIAGKVSEATLRKSGLRWWIPPKYGASMSGSINDMFLVRSAEPSSLVSVLSAIANGVLGRSTAFPKLTGGVDEDTEASNERFTAVSLQQWPSEKVCMKETEKANKSKSKRMQMGFSAAALQEMQLLTRLHALISTPFGHPNFILPVGIAIALESDGKENASSASPDDKKSDADLLAIEDPMFSLFRSSTENEKVAEKEKTVKGRPHLVFQPTPFVLQTFLSKTKKRFHTELRSNTSLMAAWFHDLLSALVHCHSNHVVMRTMQADQIVVDHSGTAKFGGLYRCTILSPEERKESPNAYKAAKESHKSKKKKKRDEDEDDDVAKDTFQAPEILLGSPKHTGESDVWAMGCLLATLLLGKPIFTGKNRQALLNFQYKIVGSPDKDNFKEGTKFPHFVKPSKRYKRGVEKALEHMLKDDSLEHKRAIDLIARMLHLDPSQRCTAEEALSHDYMVEYIEHCNTPRFRQQYVQEWVSLKEQMLNVSDAEREEQQAEDLFKQRQAMLRAAASSTSSSLRANTNNSNNYFNGSDSGFGGGFDDDDEDDDLYDMQDVVVEAPHKKQKIV